LRKSPWDRKLPSLVKDGIQVLGGLAEVPRQDWDALLDPAATPFVRWDWIEAMERSRCASEPSSDSASTDTFITSRGCAEDGPEVFPDVVCACPESRGVI